MNPPRHSQDRGLLALEPCQPPLQSPPIIRVSPGSTPETRLEFRRVGVARENCGVSQELSPKTYALTPALRARLMGYSLAAIALLLVAATLIVAALHVNTAVMLVIVVLVPVAIGVLAGLFSKRFYVLRIDDIGYQTRFIGGVGAKQARWVEVLDLGVMTLEGDRCIQFRLRNGQRTTIAVDVLQTDPDELVREFQRRLRSANGRVAVREES